MRVPYLIGHAATPLPSLGGSFDRARPVLAVRVTGPRRGWLFDGLLDTGSDDTVFEERVAALVGVDLTQAEERLLSGVGHSQSVRCRYAPVQLRISDGRQETYEWMAVVGFVPLRLHNALFGHAGFLQYFDTEFRGADREVVLTPNHTFPGIRI